MRTVIDGALGAAFRPGCGTPEVEQLTRLEIAAFAGLQSAEAERADADADQPGDREPDRVQQASNLPLPPFRHHDGYLAAIVTCVDESDGLRTSGPVVERS